MASPETTVQVAPAPAEQRTCRKCNETKPVTPETWPYKNDRRRSGYKASGNLCILCERQRKVQYEARRNELKAAVTAPIETPDGKPESVRKAITAANKLDVAQALKAGSRAVNELAPSVMARIFEYLEDPDHEHHLWALELLAQRILPRKLYEELGGIAAGAGSLADKRPVFVVNVLPAAPAAEEGRVVSVQAQEVHVLPSEEGASE